MSMGIRHQRKGGAAAYLFNQREVTSDEQKSKFAGLLARLDLIGGDVGSATASATCDDADGEPSLG